MVKVDYDGNHKTDNYYLKILYQLDINPYDLKYYKYDQNSKHRKALLEIKKGRRPKVYAPTEVPPSTHNRTQTRSTPLIRMHFPSASFCYLKIWRLSVGTILRLTQNYIIFFKTQIIGSTIAPSYYFSSYYSFTTPSSFFQEKIDDLHQFLIIRI